jgi:dihydropyrimidine dehydrogenase (NAD+) subunit PreA
MVDLGINFSGLRFFNPFLLSASPSTDTKEILARGFEAGWAGGVIKTTSVEEDKVVMAYPMMSSLVPGAKMVGLHNTDLISDKRIDEWVENILWLKERFPDHRVILSIVGYTKEQWIDLTVKAEQAGTDMVELGLACPQGAMLEDEEEADGYMLCQDAILTERVTRWVKDTAKDMRVQVKIGSAVTDIIPIAQAIARGGGDSICAIDSLGGVVGVDLDNLSPMPSVQGAASIGGYTGRAIKPVGLRCVAEVAGAVSLPISAVGGIYNWQDAVEYMLLGGTTLQVCTAVMHRGFGIVDDLQDGMARWLAEKGYSNPADIVGLSLPNLIDNEELERNLTVLSRINDDLCVNCGLCHVACRDGGHEAILFDDNRKVTVDEERCVGCGLCAQICPMPGCITIETLVAA